MSGIFRDKPKPPLPGPSLATFAVVVADEIGRPVQGAGVILSIGKEGVTNADGYVSFVVPLGTLSFSVHHPKFKRYDEIVPVLANKQVAILLETIDEAPVLSTGLFPPESGRLHIDGDTFKTADNQVWQWRGYSMFLAYRRFLAGEDLRPDLRWLRAQGINIIRVFGPLPWKETPDYRVESFNTARLGEFFDLLAAEGLRCEFVPFCYLWGTVAERRAFAQRCFDIMAEHWNVVAEMVNEPKVGDKADPEDVLTGVNRRGVLTAYGYYPLEGQSYSSVKRLDFGTVHTSRDSAWFRKARQCQEVQSSWGIPVVGDEPAKAIEPGAKGSHTLAPHPGFEYTGGKTSLNEFIWHFAISSLWTPGATLHTEEGKWGCVPVLGTQQFEIVEAVRDQVWQKIDASWQLGSYTGAHLSTSPVDGKALKINGSDIWTYSSVQANKALSVRCAVSAPQPKAPWLEVERWSPGGSIVRLER